MIKDNNHIELNILKNEFMKINIDTQKLRILNWNFILRNLPLKAESFIHLFIDPYEKIIEKFPKTKPILDFYCKKYKVNYSQVSRIKFVATNHKHLKWYNKDLTFDFIESNEITFIDDLKINLNNFANYLNYKFEIENIYFSYNHNNTLNSISFYIIEKNISYEI